jgi:uncharacterized protein YsxB (DUF464 family)
LTKVIYREYYDRTLLIVDGHSGFGEAGEDIVCAGISTMVGAFINSILDEEGNERLKLHRKIIRDGYVCVEIEKFDFSRERITGMLEGFLTGFLMLAENYPDYVRME